MLYNWDDMHIFGFAFPKKKTSTHFFLGEAQLMSNRCRYMMQHLSAFIHYPLDSHSPTMPWGTKQAVHAPLKDHFLSVTPQV